jgi:dTDP-4-amino-4,6-dideoxygalactose transaminase
MALTNSSEIAKRMQLLRSHGITRDVEQMTNTPDGPWYYQQIDLGFNYRMNDLQAALGLSQLQRLDDFVRQRHIVAKIYDQLLADFPVVTPIQNAYSYSGFHLYVIRLKLDYITKTHRQVFEAMQGSGVGVNLHYIPVYLQPYYRRIGFKAGHCPEAERYYAEAISLPMFSELTEAHQEHIVAALQKATS